MINIFHDGEGDLRRTSQSLTARQFLNKDPHVQGYTTSEAFLSYGRSLRDVEVEQLQQFFDYVKDGVGIDGSLSTQTDRNEREYQHPYFRCGRSRIGTKIILEGGMREFLRDCTRKRKPVSIDFSLQDLIAEAKKG